MAWKWRPLRRAGPEGQFLPRVHGVAAANAEITHGSNGKGVRFALSGQYDVLAQKATADCGGRRGMTGGGFGSCSQGRCKRCSEVAFHVPMGDRTSSRVVAGRGWNPFVLANVPRTWVRSDCPSGWVGGGCGLGLLSFACV